MKVKTDSHQVHMIKDKCRLVHLTQDQKHLVVYELFVLCEVTAHMLLQLVTDLTRTEHEPIYFLKNRNKHSNTQTKRSSLLLLTKQGVTVYFPQ